MRFVLGIIIGGLVTLWAASAMDMPTSDFIRSSQQTWSSFKSAQKSPSTVKTQSDVQQATAAEAPPEPTVTAPDMTTFTPAREPETETIVIENLDATPMPLQQAEVWSPFHSEASATGFANRLSVQLNHPFYVVRSGPANYQVTYEFGDPQEQARLEAEIAAVTGADTP